MQDTFWKYFAYSFAIIQTICVVMIVEFIVFGRPYISLFWVILALTVHINVKRNPDLPLARYWPFLSRSK